MHSDLGPRRDARRFAVPAAMIAECTERRLAGDWAGALRAARIDAAIDLARLSVESGRLAAARIGTDLLSLAPDLLRWSMPRPGGGGEPTPGMVGILSSHQGLLGDRPVLVVYSPPSSGSPKRLRLEVDRVDPVRTKATGSVIDLPEYLWRADRVGLMRKAYGASEERLPRFRPNGTPLFHEEFAVSPRGDDPVSLAEAIYVLHSRRRNAEALALAGVDLDRRAAEKVDTWSFPRSGTAMIGVADEFRRLAQRYGEEEFFWGALVLSAGPDGRVRARLRHRDEKPARVEALWELPSPDPDLVWHGLIHPGELHPAVREALFPGVEADSAGTQEKEIVVRCQGVWHPVEITPSGLSVPHDAAELEGERPPAQGCAAVVTAWRTGSGWLPKALRARRSAFFRVMRSGDTGAVLRLLDEGFDPHVLDGSGGSLLHHLTWHDFDRLLPRLIEAGIEVNGRDVHGRTPLHEAVLHRNLPLVRALLAAGANPASRDLSGIAAAEFPLRTDPHGAFRIQLKRLVREMVGGG